MTIEDGVAGQPWTESEVEATVSAYFRMLRMQELGQGFVKAEIIRQLEQQIPARNRPSIEYKFRNISSVLNGLGVQAVSGYKPLPNIQRILIDVVADALNDDKVLDEVAIKSVESPVELLIPENFTNFVITPPKATLRIGEKQAEWIQRKAIKRDYLERESRNRSLGKAGELLVMEYEARRLHQEGAKKYVDRIEHVSSTTGDGLGFDILSFDGDGRERFIEVKTTAYDAETPFFISPNEVDFSDEKLDQFHLYRLFAFRRKPQMFIMPGAVAANFSLDPVSFRATLLGQ
ncbi:MAG: DUF3883 domain-containing protein [Lysobacterales bacterium]